MYKHFYQLVTNPFRLAPEPDFCFSHSGYERAREYLEYALAQGEGFVMVTGRPGTGKTMLVETFLKAINPGEVAARRIAVSSFGATDLLRAVAYAYGIEAAGMDKGTMRHRIQQFFVQQERTGRRVLLIIDEAQALSHAALEELRILADLQTQSRLMLQLFLVGQESLQDLMQTPAMEQFQQRVIANYQLVPLNLEDTRAYIEHRLLQAGWKGDPEFSSAAVSGIYQLSNGVPRHINKICNRLLLLGFGKASHIFDEQDIVEIAAEMREERLTPLVPKQTTHNDVGNVTNLSEIRDSQIFGTDLAIRADKMDASAVAIAEGSRLAVRNKEGFITRHHTHPVSRHEQTTTPDIETATPAKIAPEPLHAANESFTATRDPEHRVKERHTGHHGWKRTLSVTAVLLVLLAVSVAVVPSFPGHEGVRDRLLSFLDQFQRQDPRLATLLEETAAAAPGAGSEIRLQAEDENVSTPAQDAGPAAPTTATAGVINRHPVKTGGSVPASWITKIRGQANVMESSNIEVILAQGRQALDDYRLVTPEGNNAYEYLLAALQLDPGNEPAQAGIEEIVDIYITLASKAANNNELERAGRYLDRGLGIQPDNPELLVLRNTVNGTMEAAHVMQGTAAQLTGDSTTSRLQPALIKRQAADRRHDLSTTAGWDS